jgi:DNA polymerase III gamma/tau subunit
LLDQAIAFCDGKITIEVLETALGLVGRHAYFKLFSQVLARDTATALQSVHNMLIQGNDPKILLNRTTQFYRDLHFAYFAKQMPKDDPELKELLEAYCSQWSTDEVVRALDICLRHQSQLYGASFSNYLVESLIVKLTLQRPLPANAGVFQAAPAAAIPQVASAAHNNNSQREQNPAPSPTSPARPRHAESTSSSSTAPSGVHVQELRSTFERYLRQHKPAWMPVLQSIQSFEMPSSDTVIVRAKADFAGRRLSSDDGIELIKKSLGVRAATVDLSGSAPSQGSTNTDTALQEDAYQKMREVRDLAREHDGVQAAVRIFDAKITETKLLLNDTKRKGDNK